MLDAQTVARFRTLKPGMELQLSRRYGQPMETVFAALSTPERIADWMGVTWEGDAGPLSRGSSFSYTFGNSDMSSVGKVTAYDPPRLIEHTWFENIPPAATVRWALEADGPGCVLTLTQSYPAKDDAPRNGAGWTMIMGQLDAWLAGTPFVPKESWSTLRDRYAAEMGPEAVRDGRRLTEGGHPVVEFKRLVPHTVNETWAFLTEPSRLVQWLGPVDIEPHPGGVFRIHFTMAPIVMEGTITAIDPPRHLALIWREPWFANDDVILAFDLAPHGAAHGQETLLTLTHTFPAGYDPHDYLAGWHDFLDVLEEAMGGQAVDWNAPERKQAYEVAEKRYRAIAAAVG